MPKFNAMNMKTLLKAIELDPINVSGATGVSTRNDGAAITRGDLTFGGYISMHESPTNPRDKIAQGNIGSNLPLYFHKDGGSTPGGH